MGLGDYFRGRLRLAARLRIIPSMSSNQSSGPTHLAAILAAIGVFVVTGCVAPGVDEVEPPTPEHTVNDSPPSPEVPSRLPPGVEATPEAEIDIFAPSTEFVATPPLAPIPVLETVTPPGATRGSPATTITVKGSAFTPQTVVLLDCQPLTTTVRHDGELHAILPAHRIVHHGRHEISVYTPGPGGGWSGHRVFEVR